MYTLNKSPNSTDIWDQTWPSPGTIRHPNFIRCSIVQTHEFGEFEFGRQNSTGLGIRSTKSPPVRARAGNRVQLIRSRAWEWITCASTNAAQTSSPMSQLSKASCPNSRAARTIVGNWMQLIWVRVSDWIANKKINKVVIWTLKFDRNEISLTNDCRVGLHRWLGLQLCN